MPKRQHKFNHVRKLRATIIICRYISHSDLSLQKICTAKKFLPAPQTFTMWLGEAPTLAEMYALAKEAQADFLAAQIMEIADTDTNPNIARNRIDARKWYASKLNPRKYGERIELNGSIETTSRDIASLETGLAITALLEGIAKRAGIQTEDKPLQIVHGGKSSNNP